MTSDGRELAAGTVLDEYRIEGTLGSGGFGVTYLATDISLGRRVAVEEYLPLDWASRASDGTVGPRTQSASSDYAWGLSRFLDEARALAQFDHPHIVRVYRVFEALGTAYMVTEYVEGRTLSASLAEEGPWSEDRVRGLLASLISGLEPVHAADLIHRDIKPENVMLRADGSAVLIDFGSARQAMGTKSRSVMSVLTPGYAPIEQYGGDIRKQGPWTDIYALGAVVYELLSGRRPQDATARAEDDELLPVREAAAGRVSVGLSSAVDAALSVFRSDRPQDLSSWRALLSSSADAGVVAPPPHPVREAHPEVPSAAGLASPSSPMGSRPVRDAPVVPSGRLFAGAEAAVAGDQGVKVDSWRRRLAVGLASVLVVPTLGVMLRVWLGDSPAPAVRQSEERRPEDAETALGLNRDARRLIQMGLASEGFDVGVLDGVFGPVTRSALRDWQAGAGEAVTGRLNAATAAALLTAGEAAERRLADEAEAARRAEEERRLADEAEAARQAEVARRAEEERRLADEAEAARQAEVARRDEAARQVEERRPGSIFRDCPSCPQMVVIPSGDFMMGSPSSLNGVRYDAEKPRHRVQVESFALGVYEVTFAEWDSCVSAGGCGGHRLDDEGWGRGRLPVLNVSWEDAQSYVTWLSSVTGAEYRLPSESEWEYAARAGTVSSRYWGDGERAACQYANVWAEGEKPWWVFAELYSFYTSLAFDCADGYRNSAPVGEFRPNGYGLYDMLGNVWEWVADCWHENYSGAPDDGRAWTSGGDCSRRVMRGGAMDSVLWEVRSAARDDNRAGYRTNDLGFRVSRTVD